MPSHGCDFWLGLNLLNELMVPVLDLRNGLAWQRDRSGLKCLCATWTQLEMEVFGIEDIVCCVFVLHLTSPHCLGSPLLGHRAAPHCLGSLSLLFKLEVANPTTFLLECGKSQLIFCPRHKGCCPYQCES